MATPGKKPAGGLLIGLGFDKPKAGEGAEESEPMDEAMEGKHMAAAALREALKGDDDAAIYDALRECVSYIDDEDEEEEEPDPEAELAEEV